MSAPDIDQKLMDRFAPLAGDAHLTLLLGAGASAPSGLPHWDKFAQRATVLSGLVETETAAEVLLSKQDHTIVLEAARAHAGADWNTCLNKALYEELQDDPIPSPLHLASVGHYLALPDTTTLSTLNFDVLLETALTDAGVPLTNVGLDGIEIPREPTVHHLHGAVFDQTAYSPVVGFRDYAELVANDNAWQREFLSHALRRGPLLLAGTSYRDPDIRHWLHLILSDEKPTYPALVTIVREGLGLGRKKFESVSKALASQWEAIGLTALQMHDLTDVALVIRELQYVGLDDYKPPKHRVQRVWQSHTREFSALQDQYRKWLSQDSRDVSESLDAKTQRATLWLADGRGRLARWASESAHYQGVAHLKFVPTGHDSPWIAGEAIGTEEVKLKDVVRDRRVKPTWRSVLAIPIFAGDGRLPNFAVGVLTFGLPRLATTVLAREQEWTQVIERLSDKWGERISEIAFSSTAADVH